MGLVAVVWGAGVGADEASRACVAFTPDADYVEQTIVMQLEGTRVPLRVPVQYFEDRWDRVDGFEDTAQLFTVDIDDWTPVTRPETTTRNMAVERNSYIWFLISDFVPLDQVAGQMVNEFISGQPPTVLPPARPGPAGLSWLHTRFASDGAEPEQDVFVSYAADGRAIEGAMKCTAPDRFPDGNPLCSRYFRAGELDVNVTFPRALTDRWREIQADVTAFLTCATRPAP